MRQEAPPVQFADLPRLSDPGSVFALPPASALRLNDDYRPWRKVRYLAADLRLDPTAVWRGVKAARYLTWRAIGVHRAEGGEFGFTLSPHLLGPLHVIDRAVEHEGVAGQALPGVPSRALLRKRWLSLVEEGGFATGRLRVRTLMEEAAESSIMEGAGTTRKEALDLLRSGRPPGGTGERMVLNNYHTMQRIKEWLGRPLSVEMLLELQELLTEGTVPDGAAGRMRRADETVRVVDTRDESTIFTPPPAATLPSLLSEICSFANAAHEGGAFIHPVVKASMLHFLVGYAHPFVDGNGRTARAVFYWYALRHGYSIFEYLTISEIIRKGYARYPQAYLDTELDDGDLTYFVLYKLDIVGQALERLAQHVRHEEEKIQRSERLLRIARDLNLRQRLLLEHALRHPGTHYTVKSHMNSNGIVAATARSDLEDLVRRRLMTTTKRGREVVYLVLPRLSERLARVKD